MTQAGAAAAAVFDVDGTLCATRSTTSLVWLRQAQCSRWQHRLWLASLAWRAPLAWAADRISRDLADRLVFAQYGGLQVDRLREDARRCAAERLLPSCFAGALAELQAQREAGRRIVLLSGGVDVVLQPLADLLGAELLAQRLVAEAGRFTGAYRRYAILDEPPAPRLTQGQAKAEALRRHARASGIDLAASWAYGDSINDAAMLAAVGTPVAVNADRALAAMAAQRGWATRRWTRDGSAQAQV